MSFKIISRVIVGLVVASVVAYGGYKLAQNRLETSVEDLIKEEVEDTQAMVEPEEIEVVLKETNDEDLEELFPESMDEYVMQETIHYMTHGLVQANKKWGKIELTADRVERLRYVAELNSNTYNNGARYVTILEHWSEGDFSNAVEDHNFIWGLWNGTVGKATRLLTPAEIDKYNAEHFN